MTPHALKPTPFDPRDKRYRFFRHFGAVPSFVDHYDADAGLTNPDQNGDNRPSACTAYTIADICTDEDRVVYSPDYNLMKTFETMNVPPNTEGADLRVAFKIPCTFGPLPRIFEKSTMLAASQAWAANQSNWPLEVDQEAAKNRKIAYLPIYPGAQDWFDSIRTALVVGAGEHRSVGMGTQWAYNFMQPDGAIMPEVPTGTYWGHAYKASGWKTVNGQPYLIIKYWNGRARLLMSRTLCNKLMSVWGAYAATLQDLPTGSTAEILQERVTLMEVIIALFKNAIIHFRYGLVG